MNRISDLLASSIKLSSTAPLRWCKKTWGTYWAYTIMLHLFLKDTLEYVDVSKNRGGPPKSSILIGFFIINHPFWGTPIFGNTPYIYILKIKRDDLWDDDGDAWTCLWNVCVFQVMLMTWRSCYWPLFSWIVYPHRNSKWPGWIGLRAPSSFFGANLLSVSGTNC